MLIEVNHFSGDISMINFDANEFGRELSAGIRNGLFGSNSEDYESINNELRSIAEAIDRLVEGIDNLKPLQSFLETERG